MNRSARSLIASSALLLGACAGKPPIETTVRPESAVTVSPGSMRSGLPPVAAVDGPLRLDVAYPAEGGSIAVRDSNFIFGTTGSGRASLTINGAPVVVKPNGAWLAYLPVPADGIYRLHATKDAESSSLERVVRVPVPGPEPPAGVRIVEGTVTPTGALAVWRDELVEVAFTGTAGGRAWLVLPWGQRFPLIESRALAAAANNAADFQVNTTLAAPAPTSVSRYSGVFPAITLRAQDTTIAEPRMGSLPLAETTDTLKERCAAAAAAGRLERAPRCRSLSQEELALYLRARGGAALVELVVGMDTVRAPVEVNLTTLDMPRVGIVAAPDSGAMARRNFRTRARNGIAGPFHFFWPHGTLLTITGQRGNSYRVRLAPDRTAWLPVADVRLLPEGTPPPGGGINSARFAPQSSYIDLRIPLPARLPYQVEETGPNSLSVDVYGGTSMVNFFQFGTLDPLIERAGWSQPADSVFRVSMHLSQPIWGYQAFHDGSGALVVRVRRPPPIDREQPLRGLLIAVDAGHGGTDKNTVGPTRLAEADANLSIALQLQPLLEAAGARVLMTRSTDVFLDLTVRTQMAEDANADILVSVHNNAFPEGVNPFENNGTSVYFFQAHSIELAQQLLRELLAELRLRDIGYGRADLALVRPSWMPAVLSETAFMMVPEQEAALRDPLALQRIARAHLRALELFVRARALARA
ncbi:MAG: N-acetylmuramoyl-L-alanine amidase family protein, partial [Longimicrobiales bacterium]